MSTPITYLTGQRHTDDRVRESRHRRHHDKFRRVAVIFPAGSHFKLVPMRALPAGRGR